MILQIDVRKDLVSNVQLTLEPAEVVDRLLANGYDEIDLVGLEKLENRLRDGKIWDAMPLRVDDDAEFLTLAYHELLAVLAKPRPENHRVYLNDGTFEIGAILSGGTARVRVGEYNGPLEPPWTIEISEREYISVWGSIAAGLLAGCASPK